MATWDRLLVPAEARVQLWMAIRLVWRKRRSLDPVDFVTAFHTIYGITFASEIPIPGLPENPPDSGDSHLLLSIKTTPDWVTQAVQTPSRSIYPAQDIERINSTLTVTSFADGQFLQFGYLDGTRFMIETLGNRLWASSPPSLTIDDLCTYLVGPVMGFILRLRGTLCLHASSVCIAGQSIALCGVSQAGKSTTAAALALRGVPVLTEDVTPFNSVDEQFLVEPGYPRICLWPDIVKELLGSSDALPLLTPNWDKRYLPLDGVRANFEPAPKPLGIIYLLAPRGGNVDAPRLEEVRPREALLELVQNTYMNWLLDRDQRAAEFEVLCKIVQQVPVRRIIPHADPARLGALCDLILQNATDHPDHARQAPASVPQCA